MKIKKLKLHTHALERELHFYAEILGFEIFAKGDDFFSAKIGWSELTFIKSERECKYHYCFLIPANQIQAALRWMEQRTSVLDIDNGRKIEHFIEWNAHSFYFYDASGNIAEFIARHNLQNNEKGDFDIFKVLAINEIGMPTDNIKKLNEQLCQQLGTRFWKGDFERFGTNGTDEGLFLLPNYQVKKTWFPTELATQPAPFEIEVESPKGTYALNFPI